MMPHGITTNENGHIEMTVDNIYKVMDCTINECHPYGYKQSPYKRLEMIHWEILTTIKGKGYSREELIQSIESPIEQELKELEDWGYLFKGTAKLTKKGYEICSVMVK